MNKQGGLRNTGFGYLQTTDQVTYWALTHTGAKNKQLFYKSFVLLTVYFIAILEIYLSLQDRATKWSADLLKKFFLLHNAWSGLTV